MKMTHALVGIMSSTLFLAACSSVPQDDQSSTAEVQYVIEVRGIGFTDGSADVTFVTPDGGISQLSSLTSGTVFSGSFADGAFLTISAQANQESSTVICSIVSDGQVISANESKGDYVIASCQGEAIPCPECKEAAAQASADAAAEVPYGFARFEDSDNFFDVNERESNSCGFVTCLEVVLVSTRNCPKGFVVVAKQLNAVGRETAYKIGKVSGPVSAGDKVVAEIGWDSSPEKGSVEIESLTCVGGG